MDKKKIKKIYTLDDKEKLTDEELIPVKLEATILGEEDDDELAVLLSNEGETLDIINSVFKKGMRETFEAFCNGDLIEIGSLWIDSEIEVVDDEISNAILQLKNTKDKLTETSKQLLKLCFEKDANIKVTLDDIDITKYLNIQFFIKDILKPEETSKKDKIELFSILEEQVSDILSYDIECYNYIDDEHRENNVIDNIYNKLLSIFNKLKQYYDEGLLPINLDKFFIDEWNKYIKEK